MVTGELLDACRRGDAEAFEEVVRLTYPQVYTQALRLVGDRQDAEDVAQDAYVRVFRGLGGFRGDARFETWLYRVVASAAVNHLRKRRRFGDILSDADGEAAEAVPGPSFSERALDRDALSRALETLPVPLRTVVVLKDVYGLSCQEIGEELGASEGAVKVRLHRARRRLKEQLFGLDGRAEGTTGHDVR